MTKPSKLYASLLANPARLISFRDFERLLIAFGFEHDRTVGSHRHYVHARVPHILTINPGKDAKRYQVRRMLDIIEAFGLSMDE